MNARLRAAPWFLLLALLAGAVVRLLYLREESASPLYQHPVLDGGFHHAWASAACRGDWADSGGQTIHTIPQHPYFRPPGYAFCLTAIYQAFGVAPLAPRLFQMGLGLLCIWLVYCLASRYSRLAGGVAALLVALHWTGAYFEQQLLDPALTTTLALGTVLLLVKWRETARWGCLVGAGVLLGAGGLVRPNLLLAAPFAAAWVAWSMLAAQGGRGWRQAILGAAGRVAVLTLGALLVLLPVTIRNWAIGGEFVLVSSNGGINFYLGNNPHASGVFSGNLGRYGRYECTDDNGKVAAQVASRLGRPVSDREIGRVLGHEAVAFIGEHPGAWLRLLGRKTLFFWGPREVDLNGSPENEREASSVLSRIPVGFTQVLGLGILGMLFLAFRRRWPRPECSLPEGAGHALTLATGFIVLWFLSFLPFFVTGQYRQPVVPFLAIWGGVGIEALRRLAIARAWRPLFWTALLSVALLPAVSWNWTNYQPNRALPLYNRALSLELAGDMQQAMVAYRKVASLPEWFVGLRERPPTPSEGVYIARAANNLGNGLLRAGKPVEAEGRYRQTLAWEPDYAPALANLGACLTVQHRPQEAAKALADCLVLDPNLAYARLYYADVLFQMGRKTEALDQLTIAEAADPALRAAVQERRENIRADPTR